MAGFLPEVVPDPYYELPKHYSGSKADKYERATDDVIRRGGITRRDAGVTMFVKFEKIDSTKVDPDPRAIQFRDPKYCVEVSKYLKPIEPHLYQFRGDGKQFPATRCIGKGLNSVERATLLKEKFDAFVDPVVISIDCSRFDQHCSAELLEIEHLVYKLLCPDPWFAEILSWQLTNRVRSRHGLEYVAHGRRMSGDMNTALGNCVLMVLMVAAAFQRDYDMLDDGDDVLVLVERSR